MFFSSFAAGALASVEPRLTRIIYQAVVKENWDTAKVLLIAAMKGKLSGSV